MVPLQSGGFRSLQSRDFLAVAVRDADYDGIRAVLQVVTNLGADGGIGRHIGFRLTLDFCWYIGLRVTEREEVSVLRKNRVRQFFEGGDIHHINAAAVGADDEIALA